MFAFSLTLSRATTLLRAIEGRTSSGISASSLSSSCSGCSCVRHIYIYIHTDLRVCEMDIYIFRFDELYAAPIEISKARTSRLRSSKR